MNYLIDKCNSKITNIYFLLTVSNGFFSIYCISKYFQISECEYHKVLPFSCSCVQEMTIMLIKTMSVRHQHEAKQVMTLYRMQPIFVFFFKCLLMSVL